MRANRWLPALVLALGLAGAAQAQRAFTFGGPIGPLQNQVINTPVPNLPIASPQVLTGRTGFRLFNFMPHNSRMNNTPVIGRSIFPTPKQMPGMDYLRAFKYGRGVSIVP
jgi:hypothetical protein